MSELKAMWEKHNKEIDALRKSCKHEKKYIKIHEDRSYIGCGTAYPSVIVICCNCGKKKIILGLKTATKRKTVKKQLKRQGFKDERLGGCARWPHEIE